jgi:2-polyprenyl-3-methyl-5-hydroxy-6-metoxy-1,4-benzoquinol methylase
MSDSHEPDYSRHYQKFHDDSDSHFVTMRAEFAATLAPYLPQDKNAGILEIGAGMGFALAALHHLGYRNICGIDSDRSQVAASQRRGFPVTLVPPSETAVFLATRKATLDLVLAFDVLEHVPVPEQIGFLTGIRNALRSGGRFVCRVPNASSPLASHYRFIDWTHTCAFTVTSLDFVLYSSGFREIEIKEATPNHMRPSLRQWALRAVFRGAHRLALATDLSWSDAKATNVSEHHRNCLLAI